MSFGIESKKLKRLVDYYSPFNNGEQIKFMSLFKGEQGLLRCIVYLIRDLETNPFQGIDATSLQQRISWFGSNKPIQSNTSRNISQIILSPFSYFGMRLHLLFSILAIVLGFVQDYDSLQYSYLGSICNMAFLFITYFMLLVPELHQYYQNFQLKKYSAQGCPVKVWRDNQKIQVHSWELAVGDIVELEKGDTVGADGLIIEGGLTVKQFLGYKECTVQKQITKGCLRKWSQNQQRNLKVSLSLSNQQMELPSPIVLGGSVVMGGEARIVVLCVGKYSRVGYFTYELHRSAVQRKSRLEKLLNNMAFEVSKYLVLATVAIFGLYFIKVVAFVIIAKSISTVSWTKTVLNALKGATMILMGMPISCVVGIGIGSLYLKLKIYKEDQILYKYGKDCATMRDVSSIVFDKIDQSLPVKLVKWWNGDYENIGKSGENQDIGRFHHKFEGMFIRSLKCQDFDPSEVGLKFSSFFIGMNERTVQYIENALNSYAEDRQKSNPIYEKDHIIESVIQIQQSDENISSSHQKQIQIIYLKGNSETMLKQCTHILNKNTGLIKQISGPMRQNITQIIWKMNASQLPSLITGYIQVHPSHPKFREPGYKIVMLSLIGYQQNQDNQQFQTIGRMKKNGISITLMGQHDHDETVSLAKQMGIIMLDKPSIRLRGYDFNRIVGGIVCKNCKKSMCTCSSSKKYKPILKNQDQFNRIYKHLNVLSETSPIQKLALTVGFCSAEQTTFFMGNCINDVPAMRKSSLAATVRRHMDDSYVENASEVVLPDNKLSTMQKMMHWSHFFYIFCRKYTVFALTPCLTAFVTSTISFLLFSSFCVSLLQWVWLSAVICPILGCTFVTSDPPNIETNHQILSKKNKNKEETLIDRASSRQIMTQVISQTIILILCISLAPQFLPQDSDDIDTIIGSNWSAKYNTQSKNTVVNGVNNNIFTTDSAVYSTIYQKYGIHSRHMTFIFNLYVFMQVMNYFTVRNLGERSLNFIEGLNIKSIFILLISIGLQVLIVQVGGNSFGLYPYGLTLKQWVICLALSLPMTLVGVFVKQLPYENEGQQNMVKVWPNRCYNLAVMAVGDRETLQDFQIDEELEMKQMGQ